jgi:outer membrane protein insertion porin family
VTVKVSEKGRQEISFNGGISGIGGSFFGLHYSTNNLFGRGEVVSIDLAAGNRQRSFSFSFTEPYVKNRPITAGFSIFAYSQKFFGEGTSLSQNLNAQQGLFSNLGLLETGSENLFTRKSLGASVFASAPLSEFYRKRPFTQFSRVGLSYLFSKSSTEDPPVNEGSNTDQFIPVVYAQPTIITSRVTGTFVYDARDYKGGIDPTSGRSLSVGLALAGLLGDVRTYQPSIEFTQFYPMRNKRTDHPHVFGFRIQAGTVGSLFGVSDKVRNANSLAFVDGVPIYERYFLGDEFSIRGYPPRGISPFAPLDFYLTSRNVFLSTQPFAADAKADTGLPASLANVGLFTGSTGNNVVKLSRVWTRIGGDTQILGNFEYRIPVIGRAVQAAFFADIGSSFNLRTKGDQSYSSEFLADQPFIQTVGFIACPRLGTPVQVSLTSAVFCTHTQFAVQPLFGALVARDNRLVTQAELDGAQTGIIDQNTGLPFGFQAVYLRGEVQTNTVARLGESKFAGIGDFHSSLGAEVRFQVPILNVPFRLIYAYNPRARKDQFIDGFPFIFNEQKTTFRFSVGRTF